MVNVTRPLSQNVVELPAEHLGGGCRAVGSDRKKMKLYSSTEDHGTCYQSVEPLCGALVLPLRIQRKKRGEEAYLFHSPVLRLS